ncbi:MAG: hypothetical protein AB2693_24330 [Candidatus Thiodiazotropha sp.]
MSPDLIQEVKPFENRFQEEGDIIAVSSVNVYFSCTNHACYNKKLASGVCPTCKKRYSGEEKKNVSAVCGIMVMKDDEEMEELTLFNTQIQEILGSPLEVTDDDEFTSSLTEKLPVKVTYTPSPKKDKTVCSFKKLS